MGYLEMALLSLLIPATFFFICWRIVIHGPVRSRFWRGERPLEFGLFVGMITFLAGYIGPIYLRPEANQGPLLGIFYTGPLGFLLGLLWGMFRMRARRMARRESN
jgi:hypothetical protein